MRDVAPVSPISFQNDLGYDIIVYDSSGAKGEKNYFGKLTQLGRVGAKATCTLQPLDRTSTLIVAKAGDGKPFARFIVFEPSAAPLKITSAEEAAMAATYAFIEAITKDPNSDMAKSFMALFKASSTIRIVRSVNQFFPQQKGYETCTFQTYMIGLTVIARRPKSADKAPDDPSITYSLSTLVARLGWDWPKILPDIEVSDFVCKDKDDTYDIWFKLKLSGLPTAGTNVLSNVLKLLAHEFPSLTGEIDILANLRFDAGINLGFLSMRLALFLSDHDVPVTKPQATSLTLAITEKATLTIKQPEIIIDFNPLFQFVVFTLKGTLPFSIFGTPLNALASLVVDNLEAAVGLVIQGDHTSLTPPLIMKGVHFDEFGAGLGIFFEPPGYALGVQGKFHIGELSDPTRPALADTTFVVVCKLEDGEVPNPLYASFYVPQMNLEKVVEVFTNTKNPLLAEVPVQFTDLSFKWAENPMEPIVLPDGTLSEMAFGFSAGIQIFSFEFYGNLQLDLQNGLTADVAMAPLAFGDVFQLSGEGKGITIKVDADGNPIENNTLRNTQALRDALKKAQDKELVRSGGPVLHIRTLESPFLQISFKAKLFEVERGLKVGIDKNGICFELDFKDVLQGAMSCTLKDFHNFEGTFQCDLAPIALPAINEFNLGTISLKALHGQLSITTSLEGMKMSVGGNFDFANQQRTFGPFTLDISVKQMSDVIGAIGAGIAQNAKDIFNDLLSTAEAWTGAVKAGFIVDVSSVAQGLRVVYGKTESEAASIMRGAGYAAEEVSHGLKTAYGLGTEATAKALKIAGYTAGEVSSGLKNVYRLGAKEIVEILIKVGLTGLPHIHWPPFDPSKP